MAFWNNLLGKKEKVKTKTYDEIMSEITHGLKGEASSDIPYLRAQMEKYKKHEMAQEILRACGRLMYNLIPVEEKEKFERIVGNDSKAIEATLEEIRFNMCKNDLATAMKLSEALVEKADRNPMFTNDSVSEYFTFYELFEEILYDIYNKPEKTLRKAEFPFAAIYFQHGSLLFEQKRYLEARAALEKARRWNPANAKIAFEYIETYKQLGEIEKFAELTKETFKYAFRPDDLARCYRNLGYYFVEKELYEEAAGCYFLSLQYDSENKMAQSELYYIQTKAKKEFTPPTIDELNKYGAKYGFPIGADDDVLGIAVAHGDHFAEKGKNEVAVYFLEIAYALTDDEEIKETIEQLKQ